jgi:hypothetical protein
MRALAASFAGLCAATLRADPASMTADLACVAVVAEGVAPEAAELDLIPEMLLAAVKVGVIEAWPALRVDPACHNDLHVSVQALHPKTATDHSHGYAAAIRLELRRLSRVVDNEAQGMATVWDATTLLSGSPDDARGMVLEAIEGLTALFATSCRGVVGD